MILPVSFFGLFDKNIIWQYIKLALVPLYKVIIIKKIDKNLGEIQEAALSVSWYLKNVPPNEQDECLAKITRRVKESKFYSIEELDAIATAQLEKLAQRMKEIGVEENIIKAIISRLEHSKPFVIDEASTVPIWRQGIYLPIMPVISKNALNVSLQMRLLKNRGKVGESRIPKNKVIMDSLEIDESNVYWVIDPRTEPRENCHLRIVEIIAFVFHTRKFINLRSSSWLKYGKHDPALCFIVKNDGTPILCRASKLPQWTINQLELCSAAFWKRARY